MDRALDALIPVHSTHGAARVENARLIAQLEALHPQCFGWAMACCGRVREDAEDVLHDVYVRVIDNGLRFDGRSSLRTWLFGVIANTARARRRRERVRAILGMHARHRNDTPSAAPSPDMSAISNDQRNYVIRALEQLPQRQREVLWLVFYHDLTIEEAAQVMRVSVGAARTHYARGKERMAALLRTNE